MGIYKERRQHKYVYKSEIKQHTHVDGIVGSYLLFFALHPFDLLLGSVEATANDEGQKV
jgi:hypothetical protein